MKDSGAALARLTLTGYTGSLGPTAYILLSSRTKYDAGAETHDGPSLYEIAASSPDSLPEL
jgi:hypothetical protein